jgi:VanZ family protein
MGRFVKYQLPACLWAILIFILSSIPRLPTPKLGVGFVDKFAHFAVYLVFGFFLARAFLSMSAQGREQRAISMAAALGIFWGMIDEVHQAFVPGRESSLLDFLADAAGVLSILAVMWWRRRD